MLYLSQIFHYFPCYNMVYGIIYVELSDIGQDFRLLIVPDMHSWWFQMFPLSYISTRHYYFETTHFDTVSKVQISHLMKWHLMKWSTTEYKNTNHQQMHKESFIINCNTLLQAWTLCGLVEFTPPKTTQYTVNSTFSLNCKVQPSCNDNKKFSLKMTQQGRNM
jgi:hypothetical protein